MTSLRPGDVVTSLFVGAQQSKARPAAVVSSALYHAQRPDVVVCYLTTQVAGANAPTDYALVDWRAARLRQPSAARCFFSTVSPPQVTKIGRLGDEDWEQVRARLALAFDFEAAASTCSALIAHED